MRASPPRLVGRDSELELANAVLTAARSGAGAAVTFVGEPGCGKTSLLGAARDLATDFTILECRGVEWEAELPFSAMHELLYPVLNRVDHLDARQRDALRAALGIGGDSQTPRTLDAYAGALRLLAELAGDGPVLLLVDDLHWIDEASIRSLSFIARRLAGERIAMIVATRPGTQLQGVEAPIPVAPLGHSDVRTLAERTLGETLSEPAVEELLAATAGNPLAVVEGARYVATAGAPRVALLDGPVPASDLIERSFAARLGALSAAAYAAAQMVAASLIAHEAVLQDALVALGEDFRGLVAAGDVGVLVREGREWRFSHPVLRSIVHRQTDPATWRNLHGALAGSVADPSLAAWHAATAASGPDDDVADALERAADAFARRGGLHTTARALARAGELTTDPDRRARRYVAAVRAARFSAADPEWIEELMGEAEGSARGAEAAVRVEIERALLRVYTDDAPSYDEMLSLADRAAEQVPEAAARALLSVCAEATFSGDGVAAIEAYRRLQPVAARLGDWDSAAARAEAAIVGVLFGLADASTVLPLSEWAIDTFENGPGGSATDLGDVPVGPLTLLEALGWLEEFDLADRLIAIVTEAATGLGHVQARDYSRLIDAQHRLRVGDWDGAEASLQCSIDEAMARPFAIPSLAAQAVLHAMRGAPLGDLDALLAEAIDEWRLPIVTEYIAAAQGYDALGRAAPAEAVAAFDRAADWKRAAGQIEPYIVTWPADHAEALALAGEPERALAALDGLRAYAERTGRHWALAAVPRIAALLTSDDAEAFALYEQALELLPAARSPFDEARTHLAYARRLRRSRRRRDARHHLDLAAEGFRALGARPWLEQTEREIVATGDARRPHEEFGHLGDLTQQERQVAELVAGGASNKEAAGELFLSPKTIEAHLSRIYRKLGVTSRTQLAARWAELSER